VPEEKVRQSIQHFEDLLEVCLGHRSKLEAHLTKSFPRRAGKRRPIRREFSPVSNDESATRPDRELASVS
jgi:hypothetical protein